MKIAYLISVYKDPTHLGRLINALGDDSDFYVHVDKKVDVSPFERVVGGMTNVTILPERVFVCWGGYSLVQAIRAMMGAALESGVQYDRIVNITGTDYPLWSNTQIHEEFVLNPKKEYITGFNISQSSSALQKRKITRYWFCDYKIRSARTVKYLRKLISGLTTILPVRKNLQAPICGRDCDVYFGSEYWALTYDCARYVHETISQQSALQSYFRHAFVPSELFVQTIVFNSKFSTQAILYNDSEYGGLAKLTPLHHIEYGKEIKIFDESDYDELLNSGKIFFRKATTGKSDQLLHMVDVLRSDGQRQTEPRWI